MIAIYEKTKPNSFGYISVDQTRFGASFSDSSTDPVVALFSATLFSRTEHPKSNPKAIVVHIANHLRKKSVLRRRHTCSEE